MPNVFCTTNPYVELQKSAFTDCEKYKKWDKQNQLCVECDTKVGKHLTWKCEKCTVVAHKTCVDEDELKLATRNKKTMRVWECPMCKRDLWNDNTENTEEIIDVSTPPIIMTEDFDINMNSINEIISNEPVHHVNVRSRKQKLKKSVSSKKSNKKSEESIEHSISLDNITIPSIIKHNTQNNRKRNFSSHKADEIIEIVDDESEIEEPIVIKPRKSRKRRRRN